MKRLVPLIIGLVTLFNISYANPKIQEPRKQAIQLSDDLEKRISQNQLELQRVRKDSEGLEYYALFTQDKIVMTLEKDGNKLFEVPVDSTQFRIIERLYDPSKIPNFNLNEDYEIDTTRRINSDEIERYLGIAEQDSSLIEKELVLTSEMKDRIRENLKFADNNASQFLLSMEKFKEDKDNLAIFSQLYYLANMRNHNFAYKSEEKVIQEFDLQYMDAITFYENALYAIREKNDETSWEDFLKHGLSNRFMEETLTRWRAHFHHAVNYTLEEDGKKFDNKKEEIKWFNNLMQAMIRFEMTPFSDYNPYGMQFTHRGRCEELTGEIYYLLAPRGIYAMEAFTPVWAKMDGNHAWATIKLPTGEVISYDPGYDPENFDKNVGREFGKVYGNELLGKLTDLTSDYTDVTDINLNGFSHDSTYFLNVFNFGDWRWTATSKADENGQITFKDVGCKNGILYSITYNRVNYYTEEEPRLAYTPLITNQDRITELSLEDRDQQSITINPRDRQRFPDAFSYFSLNDTSSFYNSSYDLMHADSIGWHSKGDIIVTEDGFFEFYMSQNNVYSIHKMQKNETVAASRPLILIQKNGQYSVEEY